MRLLSDKYDIPHPYTLAPRPHADALPHVSTSVPGRTEQALGKLQIRDPALLLRAAVIDQAARDLVAEAASKARSRDTATIPATRTTPGTQQAPGRPARVASQDTPLALHATPVVNQPLTTSTPAAPPAAVAGHCLIRCSRAPS